MSLRARVALLVAGVVTAIVTVVGVMAVRAADAELREEIDQDLLERAVTVTASDEIRTRTAAVPGRRRVPPREDLFRLFVEFDAQARILGPEGEVVLTLDREFEAPTDAAFLASVRDDGPLLSTAQDENGGDVRVVTVEAPGGVFVQLARPLGEVETAVQDLRRRVLVLGAVAVGGAALAAWFLARSAIRPIERLTGAAEHVAATGDLDAPVEGEGPTEVGRLATSFRTMLGALATSRRQQHELVMNASHELRTPLTSIRTNVDVLRRARGLTVEDRDAVVDDIDAELAELTDIVTELVDLATDVRTDEPVAPLFLDDIAAVVAERESRRTGRDVATSVSKRALVEGRPEALTRAVRNLVANAAKFADDGPIEVVVDGGRLTVHDAGPGIPRAERDRVFQRFHRAESARAQAGSGLGLSIVAQVVEMHGGQVFVEDSPLGGAAVGFRVPTVDG